MHVQYVPLKSSLSLSSGECRRRDEGLRLYRGGFSGLQNSLSSFESPSVICYFLFDFFRLLGFALWSKSHDSLLVAANDDDSIKRFYDLASSTPARSDSWWLDCVFDACCCESG
ncbi:hypothetical protein L484_028000 [Morus notabilis]|uniref:Uncharacterized protein n=1 Tax=Morus notabilis TaxID=981085 RepID=W9S7W3_9ROSA|nr:hypothetical protein L484_028000 [Morus notabilis]